MVIFHPAFGQQKDFNIEKANMLIQMPNDNWNLTNKDEGSVSSYIFKRNSITDSEGREIIPAIMIYVEDASKYDQDVTTYSITKRLQFQGRGITVEKILSYESPEYPISYKNSYLTICNYSDNGLRHILYMIHIINSDNKGIQIYMDMTQDLVDGYASEFWNAMKSIKELK
jgi:hypothetical protein